jgi:hypothetical protein
MCIFAETNQHFSKIDIFHHFKVQDSEICAIQLLTKTSHLIILSYILYYLGKFMNFQGDWMHL